MVFLPPAWLPELPTPPDSISIEHFFRDEQYGRRPVALSRHPFTCGLTGRSYSWADFNRRTDLLARALGQRMGWSPNDGNTAWDKVMAVFSFNTIDYANALFAIHRLDGIATPANAIYSAAELQHQLTASGAQGIFTCAPLLKTALEAARAVGIPESHVFLLSFPGPGANEANSVTTVDQLIDQGARLPALELCQWSPGQGARQPAYLCFSSGTSGLPKAVMISHRNVIANILQITTHESVSRQQKGIDTQVEIGLLPFSHIYGLIVVSHVGSWRGDEIIVLPRFELESFLAAIQRFRIELLRVVPPIVIRLTRSQALCAKYDLRSVRFVYAGAAPMGQETIQELLKMYPNWMVGQGYGMTETSTVVCSTSEHDVFAPSSGSLVPGAKAKIIGFDGREVTALDTPGELLVQAPSVALGYLNNEKATAETFVHHADGRWIRTGDEALVTRHPTSGHEHLVIVDRIKELIKVKGHQVAPAELEAHLLTHPAVADVAVIQTPNDAAGEVPKAFVVKSKSAAVAAEPDDERIAQDIVRHVQLHKAPYKWLKGGVEFVDAIPKSPSGKILRRLLRDQEKANRAKQAKQAKL